MRVSSTGVNRPCVVGAGEQGAEMKIAACASTPCDFQMNQERGGERRTSVQGTSPASPPDRLAHHLWAVGRGSGAVGGCASAQKNGWGPRIRTWTYGVRVRCPTIRRVPSTCMWQGLCPLRLSALFAGCVEVKPHGAWKAGHGAFPSLIAESLQHLLQGAAQRRTWIVGGIALLPG